jgi:hypothetical protein
MEEVSSSNLLETTVARNTQKVKIWLMVHRYALGRQATQRRYEAASVYSRYRERETGEIRSAASSFNGPLVELVTTPPCHGGGRGFESRTDRFIIGELAEWSIAAVLKTVDRNWSGGSNPSLSATSKRYSLRF